MYPRPKRVTVRRLSNAWLVTLPPEPEEEEGYVDADDRYRKKIADQYTPQAPREFAFSNRKALLDFLNGAIGELQSEE